MRVFAIILLAGTAAPALAQGHQGHADHAMPTAQAESQQAAAQPDCEREAKRHRAMGHAVPENACEGQADSQASDPVDSPRHTEAMDHSSMDHEAEGHGSTDHATMDHADMDHGAMAMEPIPTLPPPAAAGSGPPRAADAIWGAAAMAPSRRALVHENGGQSFASLMIDRLEYRAREGQDGYLWEGQAWFGGDLDRLTIKSEGEGSFGGEAEQAEVQALWSHAIGPWFDLNAGLRHDSAGPDRTHLALGIQGLAPYKFEVDGTLFLSDEGDLTARAEAELDQLITQRLVLQPRAELNLSAQDVPELGIGAGLDSVEIGLRLRYEIAREFAPYVGVAQEWRVGGSADYARAAGEHVSATSLVAGVRFWF
ncbi:copper resistance protein B [Qipengyuania sp.]|uniref:copper resistance protein B n=1 Tax=Qipengyuania sp. TaxID=2004515 RepID=UPI0035C86725